MKTGQKGISLIKSFESLHDGDLSKIGLQPKLCPAGIFTVGYGHALRSLSGPIRDFYDIAKFCPQYLNIDEATAEKLLYIDLISFENGVNSLQMQLNQNQFDALVSFSYNLGFGRLLESALLKRIRAKSGDITAAFKMWNKCNGKELKGLTLRREEEAKLFLTSML